MAELVIKINDQTYNHFVRNEYSRADVIAIHAALVNAIPLEVEQEPKTGHWIETDSDDAYWYMCSECHRRTDEKSDYCPNCGCRMVEPQERSGNDNR